MRVQIEGEALKKLVDILELEPERRRQVIKILLQHGKEQGLEEGVRDLLKLCCSDKYAMKVRRALI